VGDKPQLRISQGVGVQFPHDETPDAGNLSAAGDNGALVQVGTAHSQRQIVALLAGERLDVSGSIWRLPCRSGKAIAGAGRRYQP
jgi:hypothetical protein